MASVVNAARKTVVENLGGVAARAVGAPAEHQFSIADVPDLSGKIAVVTGATQGVGYAVSHTLLSRNLAHLHMLSGSEDVAETAVNLVKRDLGEETAKRVTWHQVDLADFKAVQDIGKKIADSNDRLDIVVNNAGRGIMTYQVEEKTGLDRHMSVNHLGHVVLTSTLLPLIKKTASNGHTVRIANQASNAHESAPKDTSFSSVDELNSDLGPNAQYGRSKLANILYARYLARHLTAAHPKILANATHPGVVDTAQTSRDIHEPFPVAGYAMSTLTKPLQKTPIEAAVSMLFAVTATDKSGEYICPPAVPEQGSELSRDTELAERLMKLSREILSQKLGVDKWEDC